MPRPTMDVNGAEYQALLFHRALHRLYGADYPLMKSVIEAVDRLEKKSIHAYTAEDEDDLAAARAAVNWVMRKYNRDEPRVPAHSMILKTLRKPQCLLRVASAKGNPDMPRLALRM